MAKHNIWVTTKAKHTKWRFVAVLYPVPPGGKPPRIERLGEFTVRVTAPGETDVISFGGRHPGASVVVDLNAIAPAGLRR